ncbi:MAG: type IV secretory system conjugative DNA transfer family protein [Robiginitomaculum sp.]|nr:type IV secretory system conjugative DNA transfer family protein [Robiginitomaculum sp.]
MNEDHFNHEELRFGSADWADESSLRRAGLFAGGGLHLGFAGKRQIRLVSDAPVILFGGSGSGKTRDFLGYVVCDSTGVPMITLDPRGELGAISFNTQAKNNEYGFYWNPIGIGDWLPQHSVNPLDILSLAAPTFHADVGFIAEGLIPLSGSTSGQYFEQRAREWVGAILKARVEQTGVVSFPALYRIINAIESNPRTWADQLEFMLSSRFADIRRMAAEALTKQQDSPREFGAIMGSIYANLSFLSDPALLRSLEGGDFSLSALTDPERICKIFLNIPAEYLKLWSPILRVMFTTAMLYKSRKPQARQILMVIDEAGQLGRAEFLMRGFTYGRGAGVRTLALFQDSGQVVAHYGHAGLQTLIGSAQTRIWFGVRDAQTAELVSQMLGTQTLEYDDTLARDAAQFQKRDLARCVLLGGDPYTLAHEYAQLNRAANTRTKQARALLSVDEVLNLPETQAIVFVSGLGLRPFLVGKHAYYEQRFMAGKYLPNPYHPPLDRLTVRGRFGMKTVPVTRGSVPQNMRHFPQYSTGTTLHLAGYPL